MNIVVALLLETVALSPKVMLVSKEFRFAFREWYIRKVGGAAKRAMVATGNRWTTATSNYLLQHWATELRDAELLKAACPSMWGYHSSRYALEQLKIDTLDRGDADALAWLFQQQQGIKTDPFVRALERGDWACVRVVVEHCRSTPSAPEPQGTNWLFQCMRMVARHGARTNQWWLIEWAFNEGLDECWDVLPESGKNNHVEIFAKYLDRVGQVSIGKVIREWICYRSMDSPDVQRYLRQLGWPCKCDELKATLQNSN